MSQHGPRGKRVTLAEVARNAGVSQMTASKVMRNTGNISATTHEKVRKVAADLGYVPNRLAGSLSSKTSDIVAVVLPSINDSIFGEVMSGINAVLRPNGYITFIGESQLDGKMEEDILRTVLSLRPAGLILTGGIARSDDSLRILENWECPMVQIWGGPSASFDGIVGPNHFAAGRIIAEHFRERGFQKPAYLGAELQKDQCAAQRFQAYKETMEDLGFPIHAIVDENLPRQWETGQVLAQRLMQVHPETDAVYCLNDAIGLGALAWFYQMEYDVPERVAVAGFNGTSLINTVRTHLTTVQVQRFELGQKAANCLIDLLSGNEIEKTSILEAEFVLGNTT